MTVVVKCNIAEIALNSIRNLLWGTSCDNSESNLDIIENYLEYLDCPETTWHTCKEITPCLATVPKVFRCALKVASITAEVLPSEDDDGNPLPKECDLILSLEVQNFAGGIAPYSYTWSYDEQDFDIVSPNNIGEKLKLNVKPGKKISDLVTLVGVGVVDANGCFNERFCWFVQGDMECLTTYNPCSNPSNLTVQILYTSCSAPKSLVVLMD